jgi:hypothetical protein
MTEIKHSMTASDMLHAIADSPFNPGNAWLKPKPGTCWYIYDDALYVGTRETITKPKSLDRRSTQDVYRNAKGVVAVRFTIEEKSSITGWVLLDAALEWRMQPVVISTS